MKRMFLLALAVAVLVLAVATVGFAKPATQTRGTTAAPCFVRGERHCLGTVLVRFPAGEAVAVA